MQARLLARWLTAASGWRKAVQVVGCWSTRCFSCGSSATTFPSCEGISIVPSNFAVNCDEVGPVLVAPGCIRYEFVNGSRQGAVVRDCARYDSIAMVDDKRDSCKAHLFPEGAITFCYCSGDWCNNAHSAMRVAPGMQASTATQMAVLAGFVAAALSRA